ncbi:hypothetical protein FGB62_39g118 [Gracilaria domingensis]|nr:hypothetical protein FGB62_39g118 [Gracilaria domingensis]
MCGGRIRVRCATVPTVALGSHWLHARQRCRPWPVTAAGRVIVLLRDWRHGDALGPAHQVRWPVLGAAVKRGVGLAALAALTLSTRHAVWLPLMHLRCCANARATVECVIAAKVGFHSQLLIRLTHARALPKGSARE